MLTTHLTPLQSVITNVQYTALAGRIFAMDQNQTLIEHGSTLWEWMHSSGLMTDEGRVYDGIDATQCNDVTEDLWYVQIPVASIYSVLNPVIGLTKPVKAFKVSRFS